MLGRCVRVPIAFLVACALPGRMGGWCEARNVRMWQRRRMKSAQTCTHLLLGKVFVDNGRKRCKLNHRFGPHSSLALMSLMDSQEEKR